MSVDKNMINDHKIRKSSVSLFRYNIEVKITLNEDFEPRETDIDPRHLENNINEILKQRTTSMMFAVGCRPKNSPKIKISYEAREESRNKAVIMVSICNEQLIELLGLHIIK